MSEIKIKNMAASDQLECYVDDVIFKKIQQAQSSNTAVAFNGRVSPYSEDGDATYMRLNAGLNTDWQNV